MSYERLRSILPVGAAAGADGHLIVGGCDVVELAERFGTPLMLMDRTTIESNAASVISEVGDPHRVFYAGKSFLCVAMCRLIDSLHMGLDVCTGGELATARAADFPAKRIVFHGNNKSLDELVAARDAGVGRIVVDSFEEIERIAELGLETKLLVRVTPGVEAQTHQYVQTGQQDSKFGFTLRERVAFDAVRRTLAVPGCEFAGLHAHIGSQIFDLAGFELAIKRISDFAAQLTDELEVEVEELNMGGGFGIQYVEWEDPLELREVARGIVKGLRGAFERRNLPTPEVFVEPGRSIAGPAGLTLYRVGTVKRIPEGRTYASVDGGMSDNVRPALYGSSHEALLANRVTARDDGVITVAGKHCESGDVIIRDAKLPADVTTGDLMCVTATGAYNYSMASNYNRMPRPPVVMVAGGRATEIVRRETFDDLLRLDVPLELGDPEPIRPTTGSPPRGD
ncbi:MAG: diaminopimelate decarboxylase [Actinomycetota bacterium]|nr:diaminopimelate decarboxylase [Actinomycetota bacterium]